MEKLKTEKIIEVHVKPNSKQQKIQEIANGLYEIWIKSRPERGKANKELIKLISTYIKSITTCFSSTEPLTNLVKK